MDEGKDYLVSYIGGEMKQTFINCDTYYDSNGFYHYHDSNRITQYYICSNGHQFSDTMITPCNNCDWTSNGDGWGYD
jgi:hypothetical protein